MPFECHWWKTPYFSLTQYSKVFGPVRQKMVELLPSPLSNNNAFHVEIPPRSDDLTTHSLYHQIVHILYYYNDLPALWISFILSTLQHPAEQTSFVVIFGRLLNRKPIQPALTAIFFWSTLLLIAVIRKLQRRVSRAEATTNEEGESLKCWYIHWLIDVIDWFAIIIFLLKSFFFIVTIQLNLIKAL